MQYYCTDPSFLVGLGNISNHKESCIILVNGPAHQDH